MGPLLTLPAQFAEIVRLAKELALNDPDGLRFPLDGHLVGDIGTKMAREQLGMKLFANSHRGHDATDDAGNMVQVKLTQRDSVAMRADCVRLLVMRVVSDTHAEIVYNGPGAPAWKQAGAVRNGQRQIRLSVLRQLASSAQSSVTSEIIKREKTGGSGSRVCPECQRPFVGSWSGIDGHWKANHEHVMPYVRAWPLISSGKYSAQVSETDARPPTHK